MITPKAVVHMKQEERTSVELDKKTLITPKPSSPRQFFARIYGHLESEKTKTTIDGSEEVACKSLTYTDSSSDFDDDRLKAHEDGKCYENDFHDNTSVSASTALAQIAAANLPIHPTSQSIVQRMQPFPGIHAVPGLTSFTGFLPPRPPLLFNNDIPFHTGFSAFLSRRRRGSGRTRRQRTTFSAAQTLRLEVEFRRAEYVGRPRRLELAAALRLSETQVKIWFQNRRAKDKRIEKAHLDHHYRTLAGLAPEYYPCALCPYKRETRAQNTTPNDDKIISHDQAINDHTDLH